MFLSSSADAPCPPTPPPLLPSFVVGTPSATTPHIAINGDDSASSTASCSSGAVDRLQPDWFSKKGRLLPRPVQRPPPRLVERFQAVRRPPAPRGPVRCSGPWRSRRGAAQQQRIDAQLAAHRIVVARDTSDAVNGRNRAIGLINNLIREYICRKLNGFIGREIPPSLQLSSSSA